MGVELGPGGGGRGVDRSAHGPTLDPPASLAHGRPSVGALCQARGMDSQNPYADRPWLAAYAPEVPDEIDEVTQTLSDMIDASIARYGRASALEFFGAATTYARAGRADRPRGRGPAPPRRDARRPGRDRAAELPAARRRVLRGAAARRHRRRAQPALHRARAAPPVRRPPGAASRSCGTRSYDTVDGFPSDLKRRAHRQRRHHRGDARGARGSRCACRSRRRATARAQLTATPKARKVLDLAEARRRPAARAGGIRVPASTTSRCCSTRAARPARPKGAILTHRNLRANAMQGRAWVPGLHEGEETFYGVLPLFHAYGMTLCLTFAMSIGAKLVLFPKFDATLVADAATKSPPTFLPAVPPIYDQLARVGRARRDRPDERALRDLGRDEPAGRDRRRGGRRRPAGCSSRATA